MKAKIAVALATLLSVACLPIGTASAMAQQYILPIGSNVNNRPAKVNIGLGNWDTGWAINDRLDYTPAMGDFEKIVQYRVSVLAEKFNPPAGSERDQYVLQVIAEPGPYTVVRFQLNESGGIPPEVLEVKLDYGVSWTYKVKGVKEIRMRLFKGGQQIASFSTADPNGGYGFDGLSPCSLGTTQDALARDEVRIESAYTTPSLWDGTWDYGEMDVVADADYATVNLLNGFITQYSTPEFLGSLNALEIPSQSPVLTISSPRISRIARVGHTTELTISAEKSGNAHLEFATAIGGNWSAVPAYPVPLALKAGSTQFTHTIESPTAFYRLRTVKTEGQ